ncbi:MAG: beta-hydroxyacyl-ACP dehydratase [Phycisphaerae bacterium]|nr:beta-hydroxyacyl-ACP dehydratase [Phycisphaerae bacterium]HBZ97372.1 beta-hydroxyacyl-ACP dehydratase [Phycisphaerales bacterium]|tara:strand:+ start:105 stop:515 length:411 start_codon:yes stop_codon:yes gene_type:complete
MPETMIDNVLEQTEERVVAVKHLDGGEAYLKDHFPTFPIMPGVMMLETLVQAGRLLLPGREDGPWVLGEVKAMKYGQMVRPGESLEVDVRIVKQEGDQVTCKGSGILRRGAGIEGDGETVLSGRFTMRARRDVPQG